MSAPASSGPWSLTEVRRKKLGIQRQLGFHFVLRQEADPVLTEALQNVLRIGLCISERLNRKVKILSGRTRAAKCVFQPCRSEQSEQANPRGPDRKCVWFQSGKKDAFSPFHFETFLSHIDIELSFENVEELVFARVLVRRGFISGCERCFH